MAKKTTGNAKPSEKSNNANKKNSKKKLAEDFKNLTTTEKIKKKSSNAFNKTVMSRFLQKQCVMTYESGVPEFLRHVATVYSTRLMRKAFGVTFSRNAQIVTQGDMQKAIEMQHKPPPTPTLYV